MKRVLRFFLISIVFNFVFSDSVLSVELKKIELDSKYGHTNKYTPLANQNDILRHFRAYTTCFDGDDDDNGDGKSDKWAIPHWVAYEIKKYQGELKKAPNRPPKWITDINLNNQSIAPKDESYHFSKKFREDHPDSPQLGYDRGHMCMKLHAWRLGENAYWNTHTVLNACPQKAKFKQGIWLDLEKKTAEWADDFNSVWIIAGPIIYNNIPSKWLGEKEKNEVLIAIPDAFFKIIVREIGGRPDVLAFIYPQAGIGYKRSGGYDHTPYLTSVDIIEVLTGLDFFPNLPENIEDEIESLIQIRLW